MQQSGAPLSMESVLLMRHTKSVVREHFRMAAMYLWETDTCAEESIPRVPAFPALLRDE